MPDEITLDKDVFKALAGDTRIAVLKSLRERRKTQSELAKEVGVAAPTVKEHVDILARAGLVREIDDGHKWKYIELTVKGKTLLEPQDKRILVLLGTSLVGVVGAGVLAYTQLQRFAAVSSSNFSTFSSQALNSSSPLAESARVTATDVMNKAANDVIVNGIGSAAGAAAPSVTSASATIAPAAVPLATETTSGAIAPAAQAFTQSAFQALPSLPWMELGLMLVCLAVFGFSVGMWIRQSYS